MMKTTALLTLVAASSANKLRGANQLVASPMRTYPALLQVQESTGMAGQYGSNDGKTMGGTMGGTGSIVVAHVTHGAGADTKETTDIKESTDAEESTDGEEDQEVGDVGKLGSTKKMKQNNEELGANKI